MWHFLEGVCPVTFGVKLTTFQQKTKNKNTVKHGPILPPLIGPNKCKMKVFMCLSQI